MSYKLLIVDDEARIRNGLSVLIEWEVYGIEICGLAEDGAKAYAMIKENSPDIVLVDINMPNMTGLDLMDLCSRLDTVPKFIILSGYNDFKYAQKALRYGALDYLLKPVDQEELEYTVQSCIHLLDEAHAHQQQFKESIQAMRNDLLKRVLHNQIDTFEFREKCNAVDISLRDASMRVGVIALFFATGITPQLIKAVKICQDICIPTYQCYIVSDVNTNIAFIFKDAACSMSEEDYLTILEKCADTVSAQLSCKTLFSVGREAYHMNILPSSYTDCISKLEKKMILGENLESKLSKAVSSPSVNYEDFQKCLTRGDRPAIGSMIHRYFRSFLQQTEDADINILKYNLIDLVTYTLRSQYVNSYFSPEAENKKTEVFNIINETDTILKLEEKIAMFFISLTEDNAAVLEEADYPHIVQYTLSKVRSNYADPSLSLKTIAGQLDVNPAYLGREFTLATGEFFNDFLSRTRVAKAAQLLSTTSQKASKIAEAVGFSNSSYFFTVFKKFTGKSPNDYRTGGR